MLTREKHIARAIQDQILKDFGSVSEFSDWFSREDAEEDANKPPETVVVLPNPRNVDYDEKIEELEARIKRFVSISLSLPFVEDIFADNNTFKTTG